MEVYFKLMLYRLSLNVWGMRFGPRTDGKIEKVFINC